MIVTLLLLLVLFSWIFFCSLLYISFFFFRLYFPFFFSLSPYLYDIYVQDCPIDQAIISCSTGFLTEEHCLEIKCRPSSRLKSILNHGTCPIHMLEVVHFRLDIHHNFLFVVVSTNKKKEK